MIIDEINRKLKAHQPFYLEIDTYFYDPMYDEVKKGAKFIKLLTNIMNKLYVGKICNKKTLININYEIDKLMRYHFDYLNIYHPGWKAECVLEEYTVYPYLKTISGEHISIIEAQDRIDKFGYTLKFYEETKLKEKEVCYIISR